MSAAKRKASMHVPAACRRERDAVEFLESVRGWNASLSCPHCRGGDVYRMRNRSRTRRNRRFLWRCRSCESQFTVRLHTLFEDSRIHLHHWCYALWAACALPAGVSAGDLCKRTGITYASSLFVIHRIRLLLPTAMTRESRRRRLSPGAEPDRVHISKSWKHAVTLALRAAKPAGGWDDMH